MSFKNDFFFYIEEKQIDKCKYINYFDNMENNNLNKGCSLLFEGIIRESNLNNKIIGVYYDIYYEICLKKIEEIFFFCKKKYNLFTCLIIHRYGLVKIKESSMLIILNSEHRKDLIFSCNYIIDNIKKNVPIWKKEIYLDNSYKWI